MLLAKSFNCGQDLDFVRKKSSYVDLTIHLYIYSVIMVVKGQSLEQQNSYRTAIKPIWQVGWAYNLTAQLSV